MNIVQSMPIRLTDNDPQYHANLLELACGTDSPGSGTNVVPHHASTSLISDDSFFVQQADLLKADLDALFQTDTSENFFHHPSESGRMDQFFSTSSHLVNQGSSPADQAASQQQCDSDAGSGTLPYKSEPCLGSAPSSATSFEQDDGQSLSYHSTGTPVATNTHTSSDYFLTPPRPDTVGEENGSCSTGHQQQHLVTPPQNLILDPFQQPPSIDRQETAHSAGAGTTGNNSSSHHLVPMHSDVQSQAALYGLYSQKFPLMPKMPTTSNQSPFVHSKTQQHQHFQDFFDQLSTDLMKEHKQLAASNENPPNKKRSMPTSSSETVQVGEVKRRKAPRKRVKRSDDMPRYPLSAYNFFFSEEREVALALLTASPEDYEEVVSNSSTVSCSSTDTDSDSTVSSVDQNNFPTTFKNQDEEFIFIQRILETRKMSKDKMEQLRAKIKSNTRKKLNTLFEGDKVKKSHKKSHGKITFQVLSRLIGQRWRSITDESVKQYYFDLARKDQERYSAQMKEYTKMNKNL
jgi:hypothetical protein